MLGVCLCQKPIWSPTLMLPLIITSLLIVIAYGSHQGNRTQVSPRLSVEIFEEGSGEVSYSFDDWGGIAFSFNGVSFHNDEGIIPFSSHPERKGVIEAMGGVVEFGPEEMNPCGWGNLSAWMKTTLRLIFTSPNPDVIPEGVSFPSSLGFVEFGEAWANAYLEGNGSALGSVTTPIVSVSASVIEAYPHNEQHAFHREAVIKIVDISSGCGDEEVIANGGVYCDAVSAGNSSANAKSRTGVVVLSGVDPLGIPEVGDNEFVWSKWEPPWLWIPALARVVTGFTPENHTMQWLAEKIDWNVSPSLPSTGLYVRMYPNGSENTFIFPRNRFEDANYEEPRFRYFLIFDTPEFLPATIGGGFGKRHLIMTFNGQSVHAANIEIFFPATATNHPFLFGDEGSGNPPDEGDYFVFGRPLWAAKSPNWFYYYWIVAYWGRTDIRLAVNVPGGWYEPGKPYVYVGNDAYLTYQMRLFHIENRSDVLGIIKPLITFVDILTIKGIHNFIYVVEHELAHKRHYETGIYPADPSVDSDGDGLNDYWEEGHFLDPNSHDTTDAYNRFGDTTPGDLQCIADIEAYGKLLQKKELWREDWADTGLQKGSPPPPDKFPWEYSSTNKNYSKYNDLLIEIP